MINKSASKIGTLQFDNGRCTDLHVGHNSNTGATILWQQVHGQRASRVTGGNIARIMAEVFQVLEQGEARWVGDLNVTALEAVA